MLSFMMVLFFEMVGYSWSYAKMKFDVDLHSCSILELCDDLVKTNDGFMLLVVCWSFLYIQLHFLEKNWMSRIWKGWRYCYCVETLTSKSISQNFCFFTCMAWSVSQQPIGTLHSRGQNDRVSLSGTDNYKNAMAVPPCPIKSCCFSIFISFVIFIL